MNSSSSFSSRVRSARVTPSRKGWVLRKRQNVSHLPQAAQYERPVPFRQRVEDKSLGLPSKVGFILSEPL